MNLRSLLLFASLLIAAQDSPPLAITSPASDELLRGQVTVTGRLDIPVFSSAQLDFAYASDPTGTWFNIQTYSQAMPDSTLAVWDTTSITDGDYVLRLRVVLEDGTSQEVTLPIRIGNDVLPTQTAVPTATPEAETVLIPTPFLLAASPTPTRLPPPTPTALPTNPVSLGRNQVYTSLGRGALVILGLFALAGLILRVRRY